MIVESEAPLLPSVLAPLVFDVAADGDAVARRILFEAGQELGLCARLVAARLFPTDAEFSLVLGGSVLQRGRIPLMREAIVGAVRNAFPKVRFCVLDTAPVCGGALLAWDRVHGLRGGEPLAAAASLPAWPDADAQARLVEALRDADPAVRAMTDSG